MVNINELRVGNSVLWNPKLTNPATTLLPMRVEVTSIYAHKLGYVSPSVEHRVEPFEDDQLQLQAQEAPLDQFEPLPLTPDILEQCGFADTSGGHQRVYAKSNFVVKSEGFNNAWILMDSNEVANDKPIGALHTLQNLYFAHTNNELEIDLQQ